MMIVNVFGCFWLCFELLGTEYIIAFYLTGGQQKLLVSAARRIAEENRRPFACCFSAKKFNKFSRNATDSLYSIVFLEFVYTKFSNGHPCLSLCSLIWRTKRCTWMFSLKKNFKKFHGSVLSIVFKETLSMAMKEWRGYLPRKWLHHCRVVFY